MCTFTFSNNVLTNFSVLTDQNISSRIIYSIIYFSLYLYVLYLIIKIILKRKILICVGNFWYPAVLSTGIISIFYLAKNLQKKNDVHILTNKNLWEKIYMELPFIDLVQNKKGGS